MRTSVWDKDVPDRGLFAYEKEGHMKKILVLSDSHGNVNNMILAVEREIPDMIIHLGDCWGDAVNLRTRFPDMQIEQVPGNCDCRMEMEERILQIEGFDVLICHGHTLRVKESCLSLQYAAQERGVDVALFGHTHKVFYDRHNKVVYLNPGSIGAPGYQTPPSYGILYLDEENKTIDTKVVYIE